jgi:hypothetical protein
MHAILPVIPVGPSSKADSVSKLRLVKGKVRPGSNSFECDADDDDDDE